MYILYEEVPVNFRHYVRFQVIHGSSFLEMGKHLLLRRKLHNNNAHTTTNEGIQRLGISDSKYNAVI